MIKNIVANSATWLVNRLLRRLRNRRHDDLSREEIRFFSYGFGMCLEDVSVVRWANILGIRQGIYVDVGSHDPTFLSNTLFLHKRGWKGVNIDMKKDRTAKFDRERPGDFNVIAAISDRVIETTMLSYPGKGTDRLSCAADVSKRSLAKEEPIGEDPIRTSTLDNVLSECPFEIPRIDYLNVDIEGHDLAALRSLNFDQYRPAIMTVEATTDDNMEAILDFLKPLEYRMEEKLFDTLLFVDSKLPRDRSKLYG